MSPAFENLPDSIWIVYFFSLRKREALQLQGLLFFKLVEAAGIEPASGNLPTEHLHTQMTCQAFKDESRSKVVLK